MENNETVTIRVSKDDKEIINHYARIHGLSMSELMKSATIEKIEDELDSEIYKHAMEKFEKEGVAYSLDEAERILKL